LLEQLPLHLLHSRQNLLHGTDLVALQVLERRAQLVHQQLQP